MTNRPGIVKLARLMKESERKSKEKRIEVQAKRSKKKRDELSVDRNRLPVFDSSGQSEKTIVTSNTVRDWFRDGILRNYGSKVTDPNGAMNWGTRGKEGALAKKMLELYGPEMLKKGVDYICDYWNILCYNSNSKLTGIPTIGLLWGMRARVFSDIEQGIVPKKKVKRHMVGEYVERPEVPKVGW